VVVPAAADASTSAHLKASTTATPEPKAPLAAASGVEGRAGSSTASSTASESRWIWASSSLLSEPGPATTAVDPALLHGCVGRELGSSVCSVLFCPVLSCPVLFVLSVLSVLSVPLHLSVKTHAHFARVCISLLVLPLSDRVALVCCWTSEAGPIVVVYPPKGDRQLQLGHSVHSAAGYCC